MPTTSIAAGLAVMVGYDAEGEPEEVVEEMREIAASLRCAEVTRAVRDARVGRPRGPGRGLHGVSWTGSSIAVEETVVEDARS